MPKILLTCLFLLPLTLPLHAEENNALVPVPKLEDDFYDWHQRHAQVLEAIESSKPDLVFIGDSITHLFGGIPVAPQARGNVTWDRYYAHRNALNIGFGWDRTQNVLWRLDNGEMESIAPQVAVVLIGTNNLTGTDNARSNTPTEIADGIRAVCAKIHTRAPQCKILLLGCLPRSPARFVEPILEINRLIAPLGKQKHITFLDMHPQFGDENGLPKKQFMQDTVHPNAAGYRLWAETMEPVLSRLLGDDPVKPAR